jgi:hypothetical protein
VGKSGGNLRIGRHFVTLIGMKEDELTGNGTLLAAEPVLSAGMQDFHHEGH